MSGSLGIDVLVVDDSAVVRQVLTAILERAHGIRQVRTASDPIFAMERMKKEWPDVVVLDVEMPRMDGLTFLRRLMAVRPTPVVICSTLTMAGAESTMDAISAGAVGFVSKPTVGLREFLEAGADELVATVKAAATGDMLRMKAVSTVMRSGVRSVAGPGTLRAATSAPVRPAVPERRLPPEPARAPEPVRTAEPARAAERTRPAEPARAAVRRPVGERLIAIGTSTGGTQALQLVLGALPLLNVGIVVVQHMPEKFTAAFAKRLDGLCEADVSEAQDGDRVLPGSVLIAPGGLQMQVVREVGRYRVVVREGPPVNRHRPSVDVLFRSVAECAGASALGVIMTGMGDDGARGLKQMRDAGARTVGEDESTCVVYGMPQEAMRLGAVERELPLQRIPEAIQRFAAQP